MDLIAPSLPTKWKKIFGLSNENSSVRSLQALWPITCAEEEEGEKEEVCGTDLLYTDIFNAAQQDAKSKHYCYFNSTYGAKTWMRTMIKQGGYKQQK